jgi:hypothetical protein
MKNFGHKNYFHFEILISIIHYDLLMMMKIGFGRNLTKFGVSTMRYTYEIDNKLDGFMIFL